jgi:hypothetical protein
MPEPRPGLARAVPEPWPSHVRGMPEPNPSLARDMPEPCPSHAQALPKPCPSLSRGLAEPCPSHARALPAACPGLTRAKPEPSPSPARAKPEPCPSQKATMVKTFSHHGPSKRHNGHGKTIMVNGKGHHGQGIMSPGSKQKATTVKAKTPPWSRLQTSVAKT